MAQLLVPIGALLISVVLILAGHGLSSTLIPLRAELASFSDFSIGLISSSFYIGYVAACFYSHNFIMRAGHIRTFTALVSIMSGAALLHPLIVDPVWWFAFRCLTGFCFAGMNLVVESWLNERTSNENRGAVMSIYVVLTFLAVIVGQLSMIGFDIATFAPFAVASVLVSMAVVPVAMTNATQPAPLAVVSFNPIKLYNTSAIALFGCLLIGLANSSVWTLVPLYASQMQFGTSQVAYLAAAVVVGGAVIQWPVGRLSDKVDRRLVIVGLGIASAVTAAMLFFIPSPAFAITMVVFILLGMATQPIYAVIVAHAFDHTAADEYVQTSSGILMAYGVGSIVGPIAASALMVSIGPGGLFVWVAVVEVVLVLYVVSRLFVRPAVEEADKTDFEFTSTANVGATITPEPLDPEADNVIAPEEFPAYDGEDALAADEAMSISTEEEGEYFVQDFHNPEQEFTPVEQKEDGQA
ncbi:MFS transporter [Pseudovibrio exalbescens]|uniref:MFS transporter n=1 Tax=Pseudovibrio exalbescens TaxID=197461 RepID=UPI002366E018|nr:MFS transporter [Pseudovibrio exalbescens]MDD7911192.1 MFS transporter [Pseudovibrio exalbescens]